MSDRVYLRPTAFIDAPFGLDEQARRLAGGLLWFSAVEVVRVEGRRLEVELLAVAELERRLPELRPEAGRAWANILKPRAPLALGSRTVRLDQPQVVGILNVTPDSFSDGGRFAGGEADAGFAMA